LETGAGVEQAAAMALVRSFRSHESAALVSSRKSFR